MNTKAFLVMLALVLVLGGSIGGAFAGGVALGKTQGEESVASGLAATGGSGSQLSQGGLSLPHRDQLRRGIQSGDLSRQDLTQLQGRFGSGELSQQDLEALRQRFASGELSQQERDRLRERFRSGGLGQPDQGQGLRQFQGGALGATGGRGFPRRAGSIEHVEGNTLTISTEEGKVQATIGANTTIRRFTEATLADLAEGMRITLIGQPGEDGTVQAVSIIVVPDGQEGIFGGGFTPKEPTVGRWGAPE